jgi:exodeoxyribonuclease V alpha subunit
MGDYERCFALLESEDFPDVCFCSTNGRIEQNRHLISLLKKGFAGYQAADTPLAALNELGHFRVLCAYRSGPYGIGEINRLVEKHLSVKANGNVSESWYHQRPVLITSNSYNLQLFNGDTGLYWQEEPHSGVVFYGENQTTIRTFLPGRLPEFETSYAMTIHKSQGSEFDEVAVILPEHGARLLTRELLYTAVTRARKKVTLFASQESIQAALAARVERSSGLTAKLV